MLFYACDVNGTRKSFGFLATPSFVGWVCEKCGWKQPAPRADSTNWNDLINMLVHELYTHECASESAASPEKS